ncbi:MAG: filamentous hemagglutinin N-terminal domain-containing protein [Rubrivivax sp.]|nr:filamentous hemagglutinin N-terminal domain-containing protein [Rubrivivax sp.]
MNHIHRLVWSHRSRCYVAVSEVTCSRGKPSREGRSGRALSAVSAAVTAAAMALSSPAVLAQAAAGSAAPTPLPAATLPTGERVVQGQASVQRQGSTMDIQQSTDKALINWQSFNVGSQASVRFQQPSAQAVTLNRVIGGDASQIAGRIQANGQVFLVNPNGVMFTQGSRVDVGGLVASTLDITDSDFQAGRYRFTRGNATGKVVNEGSLQAAPGGGIALLGSEVVNNGTIRATLGTVALAAGEAVTLSFDGGSVGVQVDPANLRALVENNQLVQAEGGQVIMTARAANALLGAAINNRGTVSASSLVDQGGVIRLVASTGTSISISINPLTGEREQGHIANSGQLRADGRTGGSIHIQSGQHDAFGLASASGNAGAGGNVTVNAHRTVMPVQSELRADGQTDGGRVSLAHALGEGGGAYLSGTLSASGSQGRGGQIDVSGRQLDLYATRVQAQGATAGGSVRLGGDLQGRNPDMPNAEGLNANAVSIDVSATQQGPGGRAIVWSEGTTLFTGSVDARRAEGGVKHTPNGGFVEISGRQQLGFGGQVQAGELLLDPAVLNIIEPGLGFEITAFVDPDAASSGFGRAVHDVSNGNLLVLSPDQSAIGSGAGYVFLRNGGLVSALRDTGGTTNWRSLGNSRWLIANSGANAGVGAVAYFDAANPPASGRMDSSNSLVGDTTYGRGFGSIDDLGGGYYAASMDRGQTGFNSYTLQRGAFHFFRANGIGTTLPAGVVGPANSMVGSTAGTANAQIPNSQTWYAVTRGDAIGVFASEDLINNPATTDPEPYVSRTLHSIGAGNWVLGSPHWNDGRGAVTIISPQLIDNGTLVGAVSSANSMVGTNANDSYGLALRADGRAGQGLIQFGGAGSTNYVLSLANSSASSALVPLTPAIASTGVLGGINSSNALLLGGVEARVFTQLSSGDLVVADPEWNGTRGYARLVPFNTDFATTLRGSLAAPAAGNALVGTASNARVGSGVTDLGSGTYLVQSNFGGLGAYTFSSTSSPTVGNLSSANSLVGASNYSLNGLTVLSNGAYLVQGGFEGNFSTTGRGAFAYGPAGTGISGVINVVGAWEENYSGLSNTVNRPTQVVDLGAGYWALNLQNGLSANGNVRSVLWGGPNAVHTGQVNPANAFTDSSLSLHALGSGAFAVALPNWGSNEGAVLRVNASTLAAPAVSSSTALVGQSGDNIGSGGFFSVGSNRAILLSPQWNGNAGAATFVTPGNAATRLIGSLSASNSLVGASAGDKLGNGLFPSWQNLEPLHQPVVRLGTTSTYALLSPMWNGERGAATLFDPATADLLGTLGAANSLVGRHAGDRVGLGAGVTEVINQPGRFDPDDSATRNPFVSLGGSRFALRSPEWRAQAGDTAGAGALTWIDTASALPIGTLDAQNSLVGAQAGDRIGYDGASTLVQPLTGTRQLISHVAFDGGKGAVTVVDSTNPPIGVVGSGNSLVNASNTQGVFRTVPVNASGAQTQTGEAASSLLALGGGHLLMTPTWSGGQGAITWIAPNTTPTGTLSASTSLIGGAGDQLGGRAVLLGNGKLLLGSPLSNGARGAATLLANSGGLAATLLGTLDISADNSFVGVSAGDGVSTGDRVSSGGFADLGNDIFVTYSPHFGSSSNPRTVHGAVTLGDSVTNAMRGDLSGVNSFFSSVQGQAAVPYISAQGQTGAIMSTGSQVGLVQVTQPVSLVNGNLGFGDYGTRSVNMRPMTITQMLNAGTDVTLQATDAINLLTPVVVDNPNGTGGHLTLQTNNVNGPGITIGSAGRIHTDGGNLTIRSASNFINNASASPFSVGSGNWMVYARDAATSVVGNLDFDYKEYGKVFGQTLQGQTVRDQANQGPGKAVVFELAPSLSVPTPNDFKTYDGTTALGTPYTISGLLGGDVLNVTAAYPNRHVELDPSNNAINKDIIVTVAPGGVRSSPATGSKPVYGYLNEPAAGPTTFTGAGFIMPFSLQVDLAQTTVTKVYDGTEAAPLGWIPQWTIPGFQAPAPDTLSIVPDTANGATARFIDINTWSPAAGVGTVTHIEVSGPFVATNIVGGGLPTDYQIQINNLNTAPAVITPRPLVGGLTVATRSYDGTTLATINGSPTAGNPLTSIFNSSGGAQPDDVQVSGSVTSANFADANAGVGKPVQVTGLSLTGADASNYTVSSLTVSGTITPAVLSISGTTAAGRSYNGTTAATLTAGTLSGLVGSETLNVAATGTFDSANAGSRTASATYTLSNGTGLAANYTLAGTTGHTATITPVALSISGTTASGRSYDGTTAATLTAGTLSGMVGSETLNVAATGTFDSANAGNRTASAAYTLSDGTGLAVNYTLAGTTGHAATITPLALSISGTTAAGRSYDGTTAATMTAGTLSGLLGSETLNVSATGSFDSANAGSRTASATYTLSNGTGLASNYTLAGTTGHAATITPLALSISGTTAAGRSYDGTTAATLTAGTLSGLLGSETLSVSATGTFDSANAGNRTASASYTLSNGTGLAANYTLAGTTGHAATITPTLLMISGTTAASRSYDGTTAATLTPGTLAGLVGSETLNVAATGSFDSANAGLRLATVTYTLSDGTGLASNYILPSAFMPQAWITPLALSISGTTAASRSYDGTTAATLTAGTLSGLLGSETLNVAATGTFDSANAGSRTANATYTLSNGTGLA